MNTWPRSDAEQIRDTRTFQEARLQLDARQASSAAAGALMLRRVVQPTFTIGQALAPVYYGASGNNYTLSSATHPNGRVRVQVSPNFPANQQAEPLSLRRPSLSDLYLTGYGARPKLEQDTTGHKFNLLKVYLGNGAQGDRDVGRDVIQLPAPFAFSPDGGDTYIGGWTHLIPEGIPIQSQSNANMVFDILFDTSEATILINIFWLYEFRSSDAAGFARFYPRTG